MNESKRTNALENARAVIAATDLGDEWWLHPSEIYELAKLVTVMSEEQRCYNDMLAGWITRNNQDIGPGGEMLIELADLIRTGAWRSI